MKVHGYLTVEQLIEKLRAAPSEAYVALAGFDHSYDPVTVDYGGEAAVQAGRLYEADGSEPERVPVVVLS